MHLPRGMFLFLLPLFSALVLKAQLREDIKDFYSGAKSEPVSFLNVSGKTLKLIFVATPWEEMHPDWIAPPPYRSYSKGDFTRNDSIALGYRVDFHNTFLTNALQVGNHANLQLHCFRRFSLELDHLILRDYSSENKRTWQFTSFLVNYHRIRLEKLNVYGGLGLNYVNNPYDKKALKAGIGMNLFPLKPLSFYLSAHNTFLKEGNLTQWKTGMKYHWHSQAFSIGYESLNTKERFYPMLAFGWAIYWGN